MQKSKAGLFLMELLIALLFFAITGAVCLSLFVGAHNTNALSENLSRSSILLTNYCEDFYGYSDVNISDRIIYYNKNLNACDASSAEYCLEARVSTDADFTSVHLTISDALQERTFITQDLKRHERRILDDVSKN